MIDKFSAIPAYLQIEAIISQQISSGALKPGDLIPSEIELSEQYTVSRMTARKAVDYLARQGIVERRRGVGTHVCSLKRDIFFELPLDRHLTSSEIASDSQTLITNRVLILRRESCDFETAQLLSIKPGSDVWYMERLRLIGGTPFVYEQTKMRLEPFDDLTEETLNKSKYAYLETKGFLVGGSKKSLCAELPSREVRDSLGIRREEPVLHAFSQAFFENGEVFEISHIYYNQQHYTFTIDAVR